MQHFYQSIHGWFDFDNIYQTLVRLAPSDRPSVFIELGSWVGRSSAYMAVEIANSGKPIKFHCVDSWEGTGLPGEYDANKDIVEQGLLETFKRNMTPVEAYYTPHQGMTTDVAKQFEDNSVDFLFLDAGHAYEAVAADLKAWMPKVRSGGWLAGHDFFSAPQGVGRAVTESVKNFHTNRSSWYARKDNPDLLPLEAFMPQ